MNKEMILELAKIIENPDMFFEDGEYTLCCTTYESGLKESVRRFIEKYEK